MSRGDINEFLTVAIWPIITTQTTVGEPNRSASDNDADQAINAKYVDADTPKAATACFDATTENLQAPKGLRNYCRFLIQHPCLVSGAFAR